jgi:hypothetical protein
MDTTISVMITQVRFQLEESELVLVYLDPQ